MGNKNKHKLVSIIVPIFNAEKYLLELLNQLCAQTYPNIEILLIDDGSTDNSLCICKHFESKYNFIKILQQDNKGVSEARNNGLSKAQGDYIVFCDADDFVDEKLIECLVNNIEYYNSDLVIAGIQWIYSDKTTKWLYPNTSIDKKNYNSLFSLYKINKYAGPCAKLFKSQIIKENNINFHNKIKFGEDIIFLFNYLIYTQHVSLDDSVNYSYIVRQSSYSKKIYSYENEWIGYLQFNNTLEKMHKLFLNKETYNLLFNASIFTDRVIKSIYLDNFTRKERINLLKRIDLKTYKKSSQTYCWKEWILKQLLFFQIFYLYDILMRHAIKSK